MVKDQKPFQREYQEKPKAGMAEGNAEKETSLSQPKKLNGRDFIQSRYKVCGSLLLCKSALCHFFFYCLLCKILMNDTYWMF